METYYYKVIIEPQEEGGFTAYIPKLPGCVSEGDTFDEALNNIKEAAELCIETKKERENIILKDDIHVSEVSVSI